MYRILMLFTCVGSLLFATGAKSLAATATISWTASPSPIVASYYVYYGTSSGNYDTYVPVGNVTNVTINGLASGVKYYFAAVAVDSSGNQSSLSPEISGLVGVAPSVAATLTSLASTAGQVRFTVSGVTGDQYVVQASTNLVNWVSLQTNTGSFNFVDPNASQFSHRFYRTVYIPNP